MSFKDLKKNSGSTVAKLSQELANQNQQKSYTDDRFWSLERDKTGNAFAIIRFLPAPEGEDIPWSKYHSHSFKGPGGWYIENCPTTNGGQCPMCNANSELWNTNIESNQKIARDRKRKLSYVSNIYVVKDPAHPENEGKVFLYRYGKKIHDKISACMTPSYEGEETVNPFDLWSGKNFRLKVKTVSDFANYDDSAFDASSPLLGGDDKKLEEVWKQEYPLTPFVAPDQFKSFEDLSIRLNKVLTAGGGNARNSGGNSSAPANRPNNEAPPFEATDNAEEDALSYFKKLKTADEKD